MANLPDVSGSGMHDCYRGIDTFLHEQERHWFAYDHTPAEHDDVRTGKRHIGFAQQTQTAERCARDKTGIIAHGQLRYVERMESIDVFARIERTNDCGFVDLRRGRRLHEDPVVEFISEPLDILLHHAPGQCVGIGGGRRGDSKVECVLFARRHWMQHLAVAPAKFLDSVGIPVKNFKDRQRGVGRGEFGCHM